MIDAATQPDASRSLVGNENTPHGGFDGGSDREDVGTSTADHTTALTETTRTEATCGSYTYDLLRRNFETLSDGEEEERLQPSEAPQSTPQPVPRPILIPSQSTPHPFPHPNGKVRPSIPLVPPKSVLKQTATPTLTSKGSLVKQASVGPSTPLPNSAQRSHRRSVSFSDGRTDGKIVGLVSETDSSEGEGSISMAERQSGKNASFAHSLRTKRIDNMLAQLEQENWQTPSKSNPSSHLPDISNIIPLSARSSAFTKSTQEESVAVKASGHNDKTPKAQPRKIVAPRSKRTLSLQAQANQTILTECSFAVSQDRLIQAITQVHPYEPHWEHLPQIDLSNLKIESITKMKDFLPSLVSLDLHNNQISYLTGIPSNVRQLRVSDNLLTSVTVYSHLRNLESLDISNNSIDSLSQLEFLPLLRDLHADGNSISTIDGLQHASALTKLSLQRNKLTQLNLRTCDWSRLEHLDLSYNRLTAVSGVTTLTGLVSLNLDHNLLDSLSCSSIVARLRILRLSYNRVSEINAAPFVNLRTLYMDGNRLKRLIHMDRLSKLENLSLRNQMGGKLHLLPADVRDVKRLYLSGNPLEDLTFLSVPCYNLLYLELAGCRISVLPDALAASIPNIRVLNLNYNFVSDVRPIQDLTRLKRLTLVGSRLKGTKRILMGLRKMPDLEMVDLRMNPVTLGWYLPLLVRDAPAVLQPSEAASAFPPLLGLGEGGQSDASDHSAVRLYPYSTNSRRARNIPSEDNSRARKRAVEPSWEDLDAKFRRDLPNDSYLGRLAYRGMVMRACPKVQVIDGVRVTEPERKKAETLLQNVLDSRG
ncbi:uncharacterized protein EI90DRAFT_2948931 [Cantharellus anzutake]|uniref:uncharacterized protein n=1 Tax=Cantharellus anzutake TaxID=1750568 RepID=UPI0019080C25|nr:uncharacterized protein EI90DRAFT_2948931 [Cantharellus anzutake]KAF8313957.1 hypothetical protein EI90DRAFT_2948931 [Cantharellus anzutake]